MPSSYWAQIVSLVFFPPVFYGNLFLIAPFPVLCLLVPFYARVKSNTVTQNTTYKEIISLYMSGNVKTKHMIRNEFRENKKTQ